MRQTTLNGVLFHRTEGARGAAPSGSVAQDLVNLLLEEEELMWHAVVPQGSILKCIAELLLRCATHTPLTVDPEGISLLASDASSGRLIHVRLSPRDLVQFRIHTETAPSFRCTLETSSLHAVFHQLKRKDVVVLYATVAGHVGSARASAGGAQPGPVLLVDYSGERKHTKHSTISVNPNLCAEYRIPTGYQSAGVHITSSILQPYLRFRDQKNYSPPVMKRKYELQRILREYKNTPGLQPPPAWPPLPSASVSSSQARATSCTSARRGEPPPARIHRLRRRCGPLPPQEGGPMPDIV